MEMNILVNALVICSALLLMFVIFREIVTWYWKINRLVEILENIEGDVKFIADKLDPSLSKENNRDRSTKMVSEVPEEIT